MPSYSQWHYLLGYLIVTTSHNWPVIICIVCGLFSAVKLYQQPNRARVQAFYGWLILGFCYEYVKHLSDYLLEPVFFLFILEWSWLQAPMKLFIQWMVPVFLLISGILFLTRSFQTPQQQAIQSTHHVKDSA